VSKRRTEQHEPLIRMVKREDLSARRAWSYRGIAFVLALVTGGLLIFAM